MSEFDFQPQDESFSTLRDLNLETNNISTERLSIRYEHVHHVSDNHHTMQLHNLMELEADKTIVIVGDEILYHGSLLHYQEVPNLRVMATNSYFNRQEPVSVKAIMEGSRIVAYATDYEKASLYINQSKRAVA